MNGASRLSRILATWFGCGYSPKAPGTVGTLGAVPLHWALQFAPTWVRWPVIAALGLAGTWAAHRVARETGTHDPQIVVIDEVVGVLIAMGCVASHGVLSQLLALILFRVFDITKPGPVALAERAKPTGLGVMLDDVVAGMIAGAGAWLVTRWVH